jgi:ubiquinone/menaquinone biosynthesis C-methylase UbiE
MKTSPTEAVRSMYDETAEKYAKMMDAEIGLQLYADVLGRLAGRITPLQGALVDTSCGSGHMLELYARRYDPQRQLVGVDLAPEMVAITRTKLGADAKVLEGDMRSLDGVASGSAAALISFFAIHHLGPEALQPALQEWRRVLAPGGQLVLAAWEGRGPIDYGEQADLLALRYRAEEVTGAAAAAGFVVDRSVVEAVEELEMDAIYLEATASPTA